MGIDTTTSDLVGIPTATLRQWLLDAQTAFHDYLTGGKPVIVTYNMGDGQRTVTYSKANIGDLSAYIQALKAQLGITCGRRALTPQFSGGYPRGRRPWQ